MCDNPNLQLHKTRWHRIEIPTQNLSAIPFTCLSFAEFIHWFSSYSVNKGFGPIPLLFR